MKMRTTAGLRPLVLLEVAVLVSLAFACGGGGTDAGSETESAAAEESSAGASEAETGAEKEEEGEGEADVVERPRVEMQTSLGRMVIELDPEKAPKTVENFMQYVRDGFYDGTIFHRVVPGFVIQGGGFTPEMEEKDTRPPIENEAENGLRNLRGTICMARTREPHSATSQFFINTKDNPGLDRDGAPDGWGYAVFGEIVEGLEVVDAIEKVPTTRREMHEGVPVDAVVIESVRVVS